MLVADGPQEPEGAEHHSQRADGQVAGAGEQPGDDASLADLSFELVLGQGDLAADDGGHIVLDALDHLGDVDRLGHVTSFRWFPSLTSHGVACAWRPR